jgi:hypothetical protein
MLSGMHRQTQLRTHWTQVTKQPSIAAHSVSNVNTRSHARRTREMAADTVADSRTTIMAICSATRFHQVLHLLGAPVGTMIRRLILYVSVCHVALAID